MTNVEAKSFFDNVDGHPKRERERERKIEWIGFGETHWAAPFSFKGNRKLNSTRPSSVCVCEGSQLHINFQREERIGFFVLLSPFISYDVYVSQSPRI